MNILDIIAKKRDGKKLSKEERKYLTKTVVMSHNWLIYHFIRFSVFEMHSKKYGDII